MVSALPSTLFLLTNPKTVQHPFFYHADAKAFVEPTRWTQATRVYRNIAIAPGRACVGRSGQDGPTEEHFARLAADRAEITTSAGSCTDHTSQSCWTTNALLRHFSALTKLSANDHLFEGCVFAHITEARFRYAVYRNAPTSDCEIS